MQHGVAAALDAAVKGEDDDVAELFKSNYDQLRDVLTAMGLIVCPAQGGYFLIADVSSTGKTDVEFFEWLADTKHVVCAPLSIFYADSHSPEAQKCVRFAVCKTKAKIEQACAALSA